MDKREDIAITEPDLAGAVFAIDLALRMLERAREQFARKNYLAALEESRNSIRMASSAIMLRNGHMAGNLDAAIAYLSRYYPGRFPLHGWQKTEAMAASRKGGLYGMLAAVVGSATRDLEGEAVGAIGTAESFLDAVRRELS